MPLATKLAFKELTPSDFYWINQPGLAHGGGQSYIDFDTSDITLAQWTSFFAGAVQGAGASGPHWTFDVHNLGSGTIQAGVRVGQRRASSVSIRSQKLPEHSAGGRRLDAWTPSKTGFPPLPLAIGGANQVPPSLINGLRIFLIRDDAGEFWAGWLRGKPVGVLPPILIPMFARKSGMLELSNQFAIDANDVNWPFRDMLAPPPLVEPLPQDGDASSILWDDDDELAVPEVGIQYSLLAVRKRNRAAAASVRNLYNQCQLTGAEFAFLTPAGQPYLEVHHVIPLGQGGADAPYNMVVLSAHAHKMMHHASVSQVDLSLIQNNQLPITINGQAYTITWHPQHAAVVQSHNPA